MRIIITRWALDAYLELRGAGVISRDIYKAVLRPDILRLHSLGTPQPDSKFKDDKFWGPATDRKGLPVKDGFKMKWHNLGNGQVQLRLCVGVVGDRAFLCQAYIKTSPTQDRLMAASLKDKISLIRAGISHYRGELK